MPGSPWRVGERGLRKAKILTEPVNKKYRVKAKEQQNLGFDCSFILSGEKRFSPLPPGKFKPRRQNCSFLLRRRTCALSFCLVNFHGFCSVRRAPFEIQVDCIGRASGDADFANYASSRMEGEFLLFLVDGNRIGRTTQSANSAKHAFFIVKRDMASGILEGLSYLNRVEPRCRTTEKILYNGG